MNSLEKRLLAIDPSLYSKFNETKTEINLLLSKYSFNFSQYTDHSIEHTLSVFKIAAEILSDTEINSLDSDEIYILSMSCLLHDVGMCIPEDKIKSIAETGDLLSYKESHPNLSNEEFIRDVHHQLSRKFIMDEWESLKIPSIKYAKAIGLVAEGHRKVDLGNFEIYEPQYFAKSGKEFVCLPYLACILRIADELDVTNSRTPKLLTKYYMPNNEISIREWKKHIATSQRNYLNSKVIFEVDCSDQHIYAALQSQFEKIQNVINYCQKVIRAIPFIKSVHYNLGLSLIEVKYNFIEFHPKGIRFSFDVQNVITAFIGEKLYKNKMTALREAIQNSVDSCRYKSKVLKTNYKPFIKILVTDEFVKIDDNGAGMDEFIIENFFSRLGSSFYEQEKVKNQFEAIGQFGVGVFSYFLLSEYVDIETKTENGNALKFRFDKDPRSYFHFFDDSQRTLSGTTVTMYLKREVISEVLKSATEYVKSIFRHIEIPIELSNQGNLIVIESMPFEFDVMKEIKENLRIPYKKIISQLATYTDNISNDEMDGSCSLIVNKEYKKLFDLDDRYFEENYLDADTAYAASSVSISQKGVFVSTFSGLLSFLRGNINIKKKIDINIDRNDFSNSKEIVRFIQQFEINLLKKVLTDIITKNVNDECKILISTSFLQNSLNFFHEGDMISEEYKKIIKKFLYFQVYSENSSVVVNLENVFNTYSEFLLVEHSEKYEPLAKKINLPVIVVNNKRNIFLTVYQIIAFLSDYNRHLYFFDGKNYIAIKLIKDSEYSLIKEIGDFLDIVIVKSNSSKIYIDIEKNKSVRRRFRFANYFNYYHPFFQYIAANYEKIKSDPSLSKVLKYCCEYLDDVINESPKKEAVRKLNEMLSPLNSLGEVTKIVMSDF